MTSQNRSFWADTAKKIYADKFAFVCLCIVSIIALACFGADFIVTVIGAGEGDFVEKGGVGQAVFFNAVVHVEKIVKIRLNGGVLHEGEGGSFGVAD